MQCQTTNTISGQEPTIGFLRKPLSKKDVIASNYGCLGQIVVVCVPLAALCTNGFFGVLGEHFYIVFSLWLASAAGLFLAQFFARRKASRDNEWACDSILWDRKKGAWFSDTVSLTVEAASGPSPDTRTVQERTTPGDTTSLAPPTALPTKQLVLMVTFKAPWNRAYQMWVHVIANKTALLQDPGDLYLWVGSTLQRLPPTGTIFVSLRRLGHLLGSTIVPAPARLMVALNVISPDGPDPESQVRGLWLFGWMGYVIGLLRDIFVGEKRRKRAALMEALLNDGASGAQSDSLTAIVDTFGWTLLTDGARTRN